MIKKIRVFDFDSTLFHSPAKPAGWKGGWWGKSCSLEPPFVPRASRLKEEGAHLLNTKVSDLYLESKKCDQTHTVMMTGRHWGIRRVVMDILHAFDLCTTYDKESLKEESDHFVFISGGNTLKGKQDRLKELFLKFPEVTSVEMWEDRHEHVLAFREFGDTLKKLRPSFEGLRVYTLPDWD